MNKILKSMLLDIAKRCGWAGSETDFEAMRTHILASKYAKVIQVDGKPVDVKTVEIVDDPAPETLSFKSVAAPSTPAANPTDDNATIIKAAVAEAVKGFANSGNPNRSIADNVTVTPVEELYFKSQPRAFKSGFQTAKKFQTYFYANVLGKTAEFANAEPVIAARKRLAEDPAMKAYGSNTPSGGGALTFMEFHPDLIANVNQFGACRKLGKVFPMSQETAFYPVREGIHTLTYPQQNNAISQSTGVTYRNIQLTAKTGTTIVKLSKQLIWDANIGVVDDMFSEIARCIAYTEDLEFFTGAGENTLANIRGYTNRFIGGGYLGAGTWTSVAHAAGYTALGMSDAASTMAQIVQTLAKVPTYARQNMVITCTPQTSATLFTRLGQAQGGVTFGETVQYGFVQKFLGIPIIENNVMTTLDDAGSGTIKFLVGDFSRSALIGDRMGVELDANEYIYWDSNSVGLKGTIRHDMAIHDVGDALVAGQGGTGRVGPVVCGAEA